MAESSHDDSQAPPPSYHEALSYRPLFSGHSCSAGHFVHHHHIPCSEISPHMENGSNTRQTETNICICPQHGPIAQYPICMCHTCYNRLRETDCKRYAQNRRFNSKSDADAGRQHSAHPGSDNLESQSLLSRHQCQQQPCCQSGVGCNSDTNSACACNSSSNCLTQHSCACAQRNHTNVTVQFDVSNGTVKSRPDSTEDETAQDDDDEIPTNKLWSACVVIFFIAVVVTMITVFSVFLG